MPTYEYLCDACGHEFEEFQSITARPLRKCPECSKLKLKRLIGTGAGIIFKGNGFYETDYRSESYKKGKDKEKGDKAKPSEKGADKKDTKSAPVESKTKSTSDKSGKKSPDK
jgi:putative FmdB family regulatory protein